MPKAMHDALLAEANKKGLTGKHKAAYIFGTIARYEATKKKKNPLLTGG